MSLYRRIANLFCRSKIDREIAAELDAHIAMRIEDNIAAGMSAPDARRDALLHFGNPAVIQERVTSVDAALALDSIGADFRYAVRQLRKSPGFVTTAVLTLALGVGANLAVFQLLYAILFTHLPVAQPEQIHSLRAVASPFDGQYFFSFPAYQRLRQAAPGKATIFARSGVGEGVLQEADSSSRRVDFQLVSDNFFQVLGLTPKAGTFFQPGDDERDQSEWPVVLRYGFFKQNFGADISIVGKRAFYNGLPIVVIGVAPEEFTGIVQGMAPDLWFPLAAQSTGRLGTWFDSLGPGYGLDLAKPYRNQPQIFWLWVLARTPDAIKPSAAAHWTSALAPDLAMLASATKDAQLRPHILATQVQLVSAANGEGSLGKTYSQPLIILMAMAGVILLVGSLNLANLQMARLLQREKEIVIRIALGASRARVLRQVAIETVILGAIGGMLAFLTGSFSSSLLLHWASGRERTIPLDLHLSVAFVLLGSALLLGALAGFGLLPAWQITRKSFSNAIKSRIGTVSSQGKAGRRWSDLLLASQVSFSLLLLCAAALFAQTLRNIARVDAGMDRDHLLTVHVDMDSTGFAKQQTNLPALYALVVERLKGLPGVRDAAVQMCDIPFCGWDTAFHVFGNPDMPEAQLHGEENHVGLGYFRTLGIPILQGRDFAPSDTPRSTKVALLNRSYARRLFGENSPIGHWIGYTSAPGDHEFQVIGVVGDARVDGLRSVAPPVAYISLEQDPQKFGTIEIRTSGIRMSGTGAGGSLKTLPAEIRDLLHTLAPTLPVTEIVPLNVELEGALLTEKLLARLTTVFGCLTLAVAALGFYGLLSFRVARRTGEIGIRMAMGATRRQVQSLFLRQTLSILIAGMIPGAALSIGLRYLARKLIYAPADHGMTDLAPLSFAVCLLAGVALLATLLPARRAASIDPSEALRAE